VQAVCGAAGDVGGPREGAVVEAGAFVVSSGVSRGDDKVLEVDQGTILALCRKSTRHAPTSALCVTTNQRQGYVDGFTLWSRSVIIWLAINHLGHVHWL
jgi:hypothetical protein